MHVFMFVMAVNVFIECCLCLQHNFLLYRSQNLCWYFIQNIALEAPHVLRVCEYIDMHMNVSDTHWVFVMIVVTLSWMCALQLYFILIICCSKLFQAWHYICAYLLICRFTDEILQLC